MISYYNLGTNNNGGFQGAISDVRIYNRMLSPQEVVQLYSTGNGEHDGVGGIGTWI